MVEEKYHLVVAAGYAVVVGVIVLVLRASPFERLTLWAVGVLFFVTVLRRIRKGVDGPPHFEV
jgi:membrane protein implicated in regulation of membrane protease activity